VPRTPECRPPGSPRTRSAAATRRPSRRRTGGEPPTTRRHQPTRNNTKRQARSRSRSITAAHRAAVLVFTRQRSCNEGHDLFPPALRQPCRERRNHCPELLRVLRTLASEAVASVDGPHPTAELESSPPGTSRVVLGRLSTPRTRRIRADHNGAPRSQRSCHRARGTPAPLGCEHCAHLVRRQRCAARRRARRWPPHHGGLL
jgi:hypothetical protein